MCFWFSSTFTFCSTCSASALSVAIRVSVLLLNSCISANGPIFFSTSLTASVVAAACSRVSRSASLSRVWWKEEYGGSVSDGLDLAMPRSPVGCWQR